MRAMMPVHVVHRDPLVVGLLRRVLDAREFSVVAHPWYERSAREVEPTHGCFVVDMDDEACGWRDLVAFAKANGNVPVVLVTSRPVVDEIVAALAEGAMDVVDLRGGSLRIRSAVLRAVGRGTPAADEPFEEPVRLDLLTQREREVLALIAAGLPSKTIAMKLRISKRTVDMHRHRMLRKVNAKSSIDMVRAFLSIGGTQVQGVE